MRYKIPNNIQNKIPENVYKIEFMKDPSSNHLQKVEKLANCC